MNQTTEAPTLHYRIPHPGQAIILNHPARFRVVACGRRFGKTELAKLDLLLTALDGGAGWWVLPTYTMAEEVWASLCLHVAELAGAKIDKSHKRISFEGGGYLAVRSGHEADRLRGVGLDSLVIDEAAYCSEEAWQALRPALSDQVHYDAQGRPQRARALLLSTPRGRNWFWSLYQRGLDPLQTEWVSWRMPTAANPFIPAAEIAAARAELPERRFRQEYLAEFITEGGGVFGNVRACVRPVPPWQGEGVCFGIDWGRVNDYTVVLVMGEDSGQVYELARFHQLSWAAQRAKIIALAKRWRPGLILAEANSIGGPNIEALQAEGLPMRPFTTTQASKAKMMDALALALENGALSLPPDPILLGELEAYQLERLPGGDFRYTAPAGGHDDCVVALALAWQATRYPKAQMRRYL